jgi:hypothetical protein
MSLYSASRTPMSLDEIVRIRLLCLALSFVHHRLKLCFMKVFSGIVLQMFNTQNVRWLWKACFYGIYFTSFLVSTKNNTWLLDKADTYQRFMSHLQNKLKGVQQSSIIFGTDQETGEINAIKACFPQSTHILRIKHLKDNGSRWHLFFLGGWLLLLP